MRLFTEKQSDEVADLIVDLYETTKPEHPLFERLKATTAMVLDRKERIKDATNRK